ncbi:MAG: T9SS type A sorting domain-containing protein [Ignavibacteriales bacterium]|nr:MAG: T9SS type A sorting domain-containing protein [Ignavibacteriales bacterium]
MNKLLLLMIIFSVQVFSQNYSMKINLSDGSSVDVSVDEIKKISFVIPTAVGDDSQKEKINSFRLNQNYPNPFNPSTTITYQIPDYSNVKVNIYDLSGQLIKELINEPQGKGEYKVVWDGTNQNNFAAASGVYIYLVRSNDRQISKQMILLK